MGSAYCQQSDLYAFGVQRGSFANPARLVHNVDVATDTVVLNDHGFATNDILYFRIENGGELPDPLVQGQAYYAIPVNPFTLQVSETADGPAVTITTEGARISVFAPLPYDDAIAWSSHMVEDLTPANAVPFEEPYPEIIVSTTAELAAWKLLSRTGSASETMSNIVDAAQKRLQRWARGVPLRGENAKNPTNLSASSRSLQASRANNWDRFGGL